MHDVLLNGVVTSIPFAVACVAMIVVGRSSDRLRERRWHIIGSAMIGALGLVGGATLTATPALALASLSLAFGGGMAALTVLWVLPSALLTGAANAGGLALMATIGNLGGYVAPYMVGLVKEATGRTDMGLFAMAAAMFLGTWLVQLLPRNSSIDEADHLPVLKKGAAVGAT